MSIESSNGGKGKLGDNSSPKSTGRKLKMHWEAAMSMEDLDDRLPSGILMSIRDDSLSGIIRTDQLESELENRYSMKYESLTEDIARQMFADLVTLRSVAIMEEGGFELEVSFLMFVHRRLYNTVDSLSGKFRNEGELHDIPYPDKKTPMQGTSGSPLPEVIDRKLDEIFAEEADALDLDAPILEQAPRITEFSEKLLELRPFDVGNARAIGTFISMYTEWLLENSRA
ncbi:MAG: hypothetical protein ACOYIK_02655 [Coriobacteriales bacterium]|jgi:fido (protein-threonine AMPylation protein)